MMPSNSRTWIWIVVAILLVVAIIVFAFWFVQKQSSYTPTVSGPTPAYAPAGQVVSGFPASLLIDSGTTIAKSYSLEYSSTTSQYTVEWNSSSSPQSLAVGYLLYLESNGWQIAGQSTSSANLRSIYAVGKSGSASLTLAARPGGSYAILSFIPVHVAAVSAPTLPAGFPAFLELNGSLTLTAAGSNASSELAIFVSQQKVASVAAALVTALTGEQWQISESQVATGSAVITASSGSSKISCILQTLPSGETQIQIEYAK